MLIRSPGIPFCVATEMFGYYFSPLAQTHAVHKDACMSLSILRSVSINSPLGIYLGAHLKVRSLCDMQFSHSCLKVSLRAISLGQRWHRPSRCVQILAACYLCTTAQCLFQPERNNGTPSYMPGQQMQKLFASVLDHKGAAGIALDAF